MTHPDDRSATPGCNPVVVASGYPHALGNTTHAPETDKLGDEVGLVEVLVALGLVEVLVALGLVEVLVPFGPLGAVVVPEDWVLDVVVGTDVIVGDLVDEVVSIVDEVSLVDVTVDGGDAVGVVGDVVVELDPWSVLGRKDTST